MTVNFENLRDAEKTALNDFIEKLKQSPPPPLATQILNTINRTRKQIQAARVPPIVSAGTICAIGLILAVPAIKGNLELSHPAPNQNFGPIRELIDDCRVRFEQGFYFASCDTTVKEDLAAELKWLPKQNQPTDGETFEARIRFKRRDRLCETEKPIVIHKGQTEQKTGLRFKCVEQPQE